MQLIYDFNLKKIDEEKKNLKQNRTKMCTKTKPINVLDNVISRVCTGFYLLYLVWYICVGQEF